MQAACSLRSFGRQVNLRISDHERRQRLATRHRLEPSQFTDSIPKVVSSLVAVHSSDPATVYLSIAARMKNAKSSAISNALCVKKTVIRHHAMRRTIWVMTPGVARLAHAAATLRIAQAEIKRTLQAFARCTSIEDPVQWYERAKQEIADLLRRSGPMSAREIGKALPELAIPVPFGSVNHSATLNAHTKVLQGGGFEGTFTRGASKCGWLSAEYEWHPAEDWLDGGLGGFSEETAASKLLELWLKSFGPATMQDIRWWFGWTAKLTKAAFSRLRVTEVILESGSEGWVLAGDEEDASDPQPWVSVLPGLDATTMGWKERSWYLDPKVGNEVFDRNGNAGPTIWLNGIVIGGWVQRDDASIRYELYHRVTKAQRKLIENEIERVESFLRDDVVRPRFPARNQKRLLSR